MDVVGLDQSEIENKSDTEGEVTTSKDLGRVEAREVQLTFLQFWQSVGERIANESEPEDLITFIEAAQVDRYVDAEITVFSDQDGMGITLETQIDFDEESDNASEGDELGDRQVFNFLASNLTMSLTEYVTDDDVADFQELAENADGYFCQIGTFVLDGDGNQIRSITYFTFFDSEADEEPVADRDSETIDDVESGAEPGDIDEE